MKLKVILLVSIGVFVSSYIACDAKLGLELNCLKNSNLKTNSVTNTESTYGFSDKSVELSAMELKEFTYCGDGKISEGEECDDGNKQLADGCDSSCHKEITCHFDNECPSGYCGFNGFCDPVDIGCNF